MQLTRKGSKGSTRLLVIRQLFFQLFHGIREAEFDAEAKQLYEATALTLVPLSQTLGSVVRCAINKWEVAAAIGCKERTRLITGSWELGSEHRAEQLEVRIGGPWAGSRFKQEKCTTQTC
eukprot:5198644-Amphidinium_carterae.1